MAIPEIDGLLGGKRIRKCSGRARWHYVYFLLLANGYGRLELDFEAIAEQFVSFRGSEPKTEEIESDFAEYQKAHLVFVYKFGGATWAQFDTRRTLTKHHKTSIDRRSPNPPEPEYQAWLREQHPEDWGVYHWNPEHEKLDVSQVEQNQPLIKSFEKLEELTKTYEDFERGVGVGVGVGGGDGVVNTRSKPSAKQVRGAKSRATQLCEATTEPKLTRIAFMVQNSWKEHNPGTECPFGPAAWKQTKLLLGKTAGWPDSNYAQCLMNLYASEGFPRSELPECFLPRLPSYFSGPKDRFNREQSNGTGNNQSIGAKRDAANVEALVRSGLGARVQHVHADPGAAVQDRTDDPNRKPKTAISGN